jgi:RNAse (barnase) inhibitor barstar
VSQPVVTYEINGDRVNDTRGFYQVVGEAVNGPGGYFGQDLDSLSDCLVGGFGTPEDHHFIFVWTNSVRSRAVLGYPETVRQLELRLARCHPNNRKAVAEDLAEAPQGEGQTVFDWIVGIFAEQQVPLDLR